MRPLFKDVREQGGACGANQPTVPVDLGKQP